ncbi:MAG: hypothetical protein LBM17_04575 [Candidatus Accumulibacter sp.]|jgi:hypothetical protein|nr:hypothetical protein [Accumulibacter sp.]
MFVKIQESEVRRQETGDRRQETEDRRQIKTDRCFKALFPAAKPPVIDLIPVS